MGLSDSEDENGFTSLTRVPSQRMTREEYEHREKKRWEEEQQQKAREDKKRQEKQRQHSIKQEETATTSRSSSRPVSPSSRKSKSPEIQHQPARGPAPVRKETDERDTYNLQYVASQILSFPDTDQHCAQPRLIEATLRS